MWLFLVTEVMFFGGLILAYTLYRIWYPTAWALGSEELNIYLGGFNTIVLIGSSLTMALAVRSAQTGAQRATVGWLLFTIALGLTFLVVKFFEYKEKFELHHVPGPYFQFEGPQSPHEKGVRDRAGCSNSAGRGDTRSGAGAERGPEGG